MYRSMSPKTRITSFKKAALPLFLLALPVYGQETVYESVTVTNYDTVCGPPTTATVQPVTATNTYISTYCPDCPVIKTTYETVLPTLGPSGLQDTTYTVTETCAKNAESNCRPTGGLPPDFTTSVATCTTCGPNPVTATLTYPLPYSHTTTYPTVLSTFGPSGLEPATYTVTQSCPSAPCTVPEGVPPPGFTAVESVCNDCGPTPISAIITYPAGDAAPATVTGAPVPPYTPAPRPALPTDGSGQEGGQEGGAQPSNIPGTSGPGSRGGSSASGAAAGGAGSGSGTSTGAAQEPEFTGAASTRSISALLVILVAVVISLQNLGF